MIIYSEAGDIGLWTIIVLWQHKDMDSNCCLEDTSLFFFNKNGVS